MTNNIRTGGKKKKRKKNSKSKGIYYFYSKIQNSFSRDNKLFPSLFILPFSKGVYNLSTIFKNDKYLPGFVSKVNTL